MMECKCDCLLNIDGKCTRQSKEDMTALEKWKNDFKGFISELSMPRDDYKGIMEYINEVPNETTSGLNQQPCEDCISRQAVDKLSKELVHTTRDKADFLCNFWEGLQKLPSVTPKEKTGHWIDNHTTCDCCGWQMIDDVMESPNMVFFLFCPNCGARMSESQESEVSE